MKNSAIEQMFAGTRGTSDSVKRTEEDEEMEQAVSECEEKLLSLLKDNPKALAAYEEYKCAVEERSASETISFYKEGFRFGFLMALDVFEA